jgi:(p)ppGpp synthase/HD superfamily hydrolase
MSNINIGTAICIAANGHLDQIDRSGKPYILHPLRVMMKMDVADEMVVAVLHDIVEDTNWTFEELEKLGVNPSSIVALKLLTKVESDDYSDYISKISKNKLATKVKISDLEDNMRIDRIQSPKEKDWVRMAKYHEALKFLNNGNHDG